MRRFANILTSLGTQPSDTLMRGGARFAAVRHLATKSRKLLHRSKMQRYTDRVPAYGFQLDRREAAEKALGEPILLAQYSNVIQQSPPITSLLQDLLLQWIACQYLESVPIVVDAKLWGTFPVKASEEDRDRHAHLFHRDVNDFRFFKFFFYLTDIGDSEEAHNCVVAPRHHPSRAHPRNPRNIRRYTDEEVGKTITAPCTICAPSPSFDQLRNILRRAIA